MSIKLKLLKAVGLNRLSPRWLKVICLQLVMNEVEKSVKSLFRGVDLTKLTPEQRESIHSHIDKMNLARGKGMQA